MKFFRTKRYRFIIYLLAGLGMTSPTFAAEANDNSSVQDIKQETIELLQARKALGNLDNRIDRLEPHMLGHWDEMDQAARDNAQASLQALRQ